MIRRPPRSPLFPSPPLSRSTEPTADEWSRWNAPQVVSFRRKLAPYLAVNAILVRSEEHTSELQSQSNLVCRLLLEKKKARIEKSTVLPMTCQAAENELPTVH